MCARKVYAAPWNAANLLCYDPSSGKVTGMTRNSYAPYIALIYNLSDGFGSLQQVKFVAHS